jgi:hypothetical protein
VAKAAQGRLPVSVESVERAEVEAALAFYTQVGRRSSEFETFSFVDEQFHALLPQ